MKKMMFLYLLFFLLGPTSGQPDGELLKQVDELRTRLKALEKENQAIRSERRSSDSIEYCAIRLEIFEVVSDVSKLDFDFRNTTEKIAVTGLFTRLMQANNPASDILGFRFTDLVFSCADKHFKDELKNDDDKKRFSQVVDKIVNNPVVSSLARVNPLTSVVSSIISTIVGFTTALVNVDKEGGRIRDVSIEQHNPFDQKNIHAFRNELQLYINFYDELIMASDKYLEGLDNLNAKYAFLMQSVRSYEDELLSKLGIKEENHLISLTLSFPEPNRHEIDYSMLTHDPMIRQTLTTARKYPLLKQSVSEFKREYNTLIFNFLTRYLNTLETAKKFPETVIDKSRIDELVRDIETFITNQRNSAQEEPDIFN